MKIIFLAFHLVIVGECCTYEKHSSDHCCLSARSFFVKESYKCDAVCEAIQNNDDNANPNQKTTKVLTAESNDIKDIPMKADVDSQNFVKVQAGVFAMQGRRPAMEDRFVIEENINDSTGVSLFAIFDGHAGSFVADFAKNVIVPKIVKKIGEAKIVSQTSNQKTNEDEIYKRRNSPNDDEEPKTFEAKYYVNGNAIDYRRMLEDEIISADYHLVQQLWYRKNHAGSTALIAVLEGAKLTVANVGDSRGVMCDSEGKTIPLSYDHKPNDPSEHKRIKEAGGFIAHYGCWRVSGVLAMSRALGDFSLKPKLVIADPDVLTFDLSDHKPQFLILASDGLWDTFTNEDAVAFIKKHLHEPDFGAKSISHESYRRGSSDNIATIVVVFKHGAFHIGSSGESTISKSLKDVFMQKDVGQLKSKL